MYIPPVFELSIVGVVSPNSANQERIVLRPAQEVDLTAFGIMLGRQTPNGLFPIFDSFFWFGNVVVAPPSWLIVHTGRGSYQRELDPNTKEELHHFFWNRWFTLFGDPNVLPIVFRIGSLVVGPQLREPLRLK